MTISQKNKQFKFSIKITVVSLFLLMTSLTVIVAISLQFYFTSSLAVESTLITYRQSAASTSEYLTAMDRRALDATRILAGNPDILSEGRVTERTRDIFAEVLDENPLFYAAYIGFGDGDFYELINLNTSEAVRMQLRALPQDRWVVITVLGKGDRRTREFLYYDEQFNLRTSRTERSDYLASKRPWYIQAKLGKVHKTAPYQFQHLQAPGQTYSMRIAGQDAVLAVDIALSAMSDKLNEQMLSKDSRIYLYQGSGEIIASSESRMPPTVMPKVEPLVLNDEQRQLVEKNPILTVSNELDWPPFDFVIAGEPFGYAIDVLSMIEQMTGLQFDYVNGYSWPQLVAMYRTGQIDILQPVVGTEQNAALGILSKAFAEPSDGILMRKDQTPVTSIRQLQGKRLAIPAGWSIIASFKQMFPDIDIVEVDGVRGLFDAVRRGEVDAGLDTAAILHYTTRQFFFDDVAIYEELDWGESSIPNSLHFVVRPQLKEVIELINLALDNLGEQQHSWLNARWLVDAERDIAQDAMVPFQELISLASKSTDLNQLHKMELDGEPHFVYVQAIGQNHRAADFFAVITPESAVLAPAVAQVNAVLLITSGCLLLLLPLAFWLASLIVKPIKHLALENEKIKRRRYGELDPMESHIIEIDELSGSMMTMAHSIRQHAKEREELMESFIQLIAQAIDDKSAYTAGHCARVPELAILLAQKAEESRRPPFDTFGFGNEDAWREFRIGAWLHDCGKITTPEHIIDKSTKLETIYNRIHEIRMRFEVLWRDAEIDYWKQYLNAPSDEKRNRHELEQRQRQLQEDFAFVANCNLGGESMSEADIDRLNQLARITWRRHFDDRLGLSPIEVARYPEEQTPLPVTEPLLADKPWHIIKRLRNNIHDERLGIKMAIPEHLYNLGELHNLTVSRGTLTEEDRFKINEHMISTIKMLDKLPLPEDLLQVPRYASTHHETLDGRGYPRMLIAKDLSIPERIMVLADIFEALTAADRPYKDAKPISAALDILHRMVQEQHVDRDVFELFLRSGAYLEYAKRYLRTEQVDAVDIRRYLGQ
ncbi:HD domain-containing phosphohydrolase [Methylotuvimicrobium buryatense]|uniref:Transporter substrate-binding domain-containing protein n=1 Tax=Methylotuvimicrobium buryatense TaxID=95641 RepID=A0A4P9UL91_METBY|nr:HD domain-containing phosphohydrolase [Methylotuvimicrobium buryatense]QCW81123.1 transporter substrate-binding domain-containing protein [Methylotuvimicrobium buryatense]